LFVSFTPSPNDGGTPITGYRATCIVNPQRGYITTDLGAPRASTFSMTSPLFVPAGPNTLYTCSVIARNAVEPSEPNGLISTGAITTGIPFQPGVPDVVAAPGRMLVSFNIDDLDGNGSPITGVVATCVSEDGGNGPNTSSGLTSPLVVGGLTRG